MRKEGKLFIIAIIAIFCIITCLYITNISAAEFSSGNVSTWTAENWKKVSEMDYKERDSIWAKATPEQIEEIIKKLGPTEVKESGGFGGFLTKKENVPVLENVIGFDNPKLGWWPQGTTGKKIIGDGETFLDLETLPVGVNKLEYKDGTFILGFKDGSKIVIEKGATDKNGKLVKFPYQDLKDSKGLNDLDIKFATKNGEVIFRESGFEIKGEGTVFKIGDLSFERKIGETIPNSIVTIGDGRYTLVGVEFKKDNFVAARATSYEFVVGFGKTDRLAKILSFKDVDGNWVFLKLDNQGRVDAISKPGFHEDKWVPISLTLEQDGPLKEIYDDSGDTMRKIMTEAKKYLTSETKTIGYDYVTSEFYKDQGLKKYANEVSVEGYPDNFLNLNGLSLDVGGAGRIDVLRDLTGVSAYNTNDYYVKSGDIQLKFDKNGVNYPTKIVTNAFNIEDISVIMDGKILGEPYTLTGKSDGSKMVSKSLYFTAGRETRISPDGITTDVHLDIPTDYLETIRERIESKGWSGYYTDYLSDSLAETPYSVEVDLFIPPQVIPDKVPSAILKAVSFFTSKNADPTKGEVTYGETGIRYLYDNLLEPGLDLKLRSLNVPFKGEDYQIRESAITDIKSLVNTALLNTNEVKMGGQYNTQGFKVGFENNPQGNPYLILRTPGNEIQRIELKDIDKGPQTATLARNILASSIRAPVMERGEINSYSYSTFGGPNMYWPRDYLRRLWYQNLGRGSDQWDKLMGKGDQQFFESENGVIHTYLKKK
ncbi:MAG: hypothetical protein WC867_04190 [Candidatus Pacearchaeota archaeon]|jgi:hypothetical protein